MAPEEEDNQNEHEEIEKEPLELEDLLELFREPEEPPKPGTNPMWLVLILIVLIGGCWLAVTGVQAFVKEMTELQGGAPREGKSAERAPTLGPVADVVAAYRERSTKGMSKDEIRWILKDFEKLGYTEELLAFRIISDRGIYEGKGWERPDATERASLRAAALRTATREREWFAAALAEGLMLNREQQAEMKQKLAAALARDAGKFDAVETLLRETGERLSQGQEFDRKKFSELTGIPEDTDFGQPIGNNVVFAAVVDVANPQVWLKSETYAPWNLCQLSADQLSLTNQEQVSAQHGENAGNWLTIAANLEPANDEPPLSRLWGEAACILPFAAAQLPPHPFYGEGLVEDDTLSAVARLNSAQFKLVLLFQPELAEKLMPLLDEE